MTYNMTFEEQMEDKIQNYEQVLDRQVIETLRTLYNTYLYWDNVQFNLLNNVGRSAVDDNNNFERAGRERDEAWVLFNDTITRVQEAVLEGHQR